MNLLLAAFLLNAAPATAPEDAVKTVNETVVVKTEQKDLLGHSAISTIRQAYIQGKYQDAFKELDESYKEVQEKEGLQTLKEMRIGPAENQKEWEELMRSTIQERNIALLEAIKQGETQGEIADRVASAAAPHSPDLDEALSRLGRLHMTAPGSGGNEDENKIIAIDFEYEYKALHLDMPLILGQKGESLKEKQIALKMEMLDKMLQASKGFKDTVLKGAVEAVHSNLDVLLEQNWDMAELHKLIQGNASSDIEKNLADILSRSREKFSELSKTFVEKQTVQRDDQ